MRTRGLPVGAMPESIAGLLRPEISRLRLSLEAAANGNRQAALQCLLLDPVITDIETTKAVLEDYLVSYRQCLPKF